MEEGRGTLLEMTPLTQADSLDDDGNVDEENLAELLGGSLEESTSARAATKGGGDATIPSTTAKGLDIEARNAREGTTSDASNRFDDSGVTLLETSGMGAARHDKNDTRFWPSSRAPSESSPPPRKGRVLGLDSEARRGASKAGDSRRESGGGIETNPDGGVLESFDGEDQTTTSAVWRECLVPVKLLQEERVRAILFVYGVYSVRREEKPLAPACGHMRQTLCRRI